MDELDLFRDFRRDVAAPSADARRRASARLTSAIEGRHGRGTRVLRLIRARPGRTGLALAALASATAAALFVSTPWQSSPGFLERARAALTPPAGTVLHMKFETTYSSTDFSCTVTRGPSEAWIDQTPPHRFRLLLQQVQGTGDPRALACERGTRSEFGGTLDTGAWFMFVPPDTVTPYSPQFLPLPIDPAAWLRERISSGSAHYDGETELDGRTVGRIRDYVQWDCPLPGCERDPVYVYVDPETFYPVQIESPHTYINPPGGPVRRVRTVTRYLTFEYLPRTPANLALADIRAQQHRTRPDRERPRAIGTSPHGARSDQRLIKVLSVTTSADLLQDKPPRGPSKGDVMVGSSVLRNAVPQFGKGKGAVVGRNRWRSVLESPKVQTLRATATLPGGTFWCRGRVLVSAYGAAVGRVVGGTGAFARATGTCVATRAAKNRYGADLLIVFRLQFAG